MNTGLGQTLISHLDLESFEVCWWQATTNRDNDDGSKENLNILKKEQKFNFQQEKHGVCVWVKLVYNGKYSKTEKSEEKKGQEIFRCLRQQGA